MLSKDNHAFFKNENIVKSTILVFFSVKRKTSSENSHPPSCLFDVAGTYSHDELQLITRTLSVVTKHIKCLSRRTVRTDGRGLDFHLVNAAVFHH